MKLDWEITVRQYTDTNPFSTTKGEKILEISCDGRAQTYLARFYPVEVAVRDFTTHIVRLNNGKEISENERDQGEGADGSCKTSQVSGWQVDSGRSWGTGQNR